jgi:hypothetical protein
MALTYFNRATNLSVKIDIHAIQFNGKKLFFKLYFNKKRSL